MDILVIRHGESEADILDVHEGRADFELTKRGYMQAVAMARFVADNFKLTRIYASTLKRAAQTAKYLSDKTGIPIEFDSELMEFNNGLLAGLSREEADRLYPKVENTPIDKAVYGQESKAAFRNRAVNVLNRILKENDPEAVIAIVTHGGMVNQLYGALFHTPVGGNAFVCTADAGIHIWKITDHGSYVLKANVDDHARGI
jgi:2,3-bisphosphoglycerate-dependent phosphoglycerate mutase